MTNTVNVRNPNVRISVNAEKRTNACLVQKRSDFECSRLSYSVRVSNVRISDSWDQKARTARSDISHLGFWSQLSEIRTFENRTLQLSLEHSKFERLYTQQAFVQFSDVDYISSINLTLKQLNFFLPLKYYQLFQPFICQMFGFQMFQSVRSNLLPNRIVLSKI